MKYNFLQLCFKTIYLYSKHGLKAKKHIQEYNYNVSNKLAVSKSQETAQLFSDNGCF